MSSCGFASYMAFGQSTTHRIKVVLHLQQLWVPHALYLLEGGCGASAPVSSAILISSSLPGKNISSKPPSSPSSSRRPRTCSPVNTALTTLSSMPTIYFLLLCIRLAMVLTSKYEVHLLISPRKYLERLLCY